MSKTGNEKQGLKNKAWTKMNWFHDKNSQQYCTWYNRVFIDKHWTGDHNKVTKTKTGLKQKQKQMGNPKQNAWCEGGISARFAFI